MAQLNGGSTVAGNEIIHEGNFEEKGIAKQSDVDDINATIGTATLATTDKTLKGAINEVRESVTSGGSVDNANKLNNQTADYYLNYTNLTNKPVSMPANGGNADTVDNKHASDFAPSDYGLGGHAKRLSDSTDLNTIIDNGWYDVNNPENGVSGLGWHKLLVICSGDTDYVTQLAFTMNNGTQGSMYIREKRTSIGWSNWIKVIDENGFSRIDISNKTVDLNDITLANGIVTNQYYIEKTNGGSSNISNIPVTDNPFILNVELIRWASASDYITKQTCISSGTKRIYERFCSSGTWTSWTQIAKTSDIPTSLPANGGHASTADKWQAARNIALTGDITGSASVDGSTDASIATTLKNSGVTVGTYRSVTVDAKGRVTAGTNPTTLAGYGITDGALKTDVQSSVQNVSTQPTNQMIGGIWFAPI